MDYALPSSSPYRFKHIHLAEVHSYTHTHTHTHSHTYTHTHTHTHTHAHTHTYITPPEYRVEKFVLDKRGVVDVGPAIFDPRDEVLLIQEEVQELQRMKHFFSELLHKLVACWWHAVACCVNYVVLVGL